MGKVVKATGLSSRGLRVRLPSPLRNDIPLWRNWQRAWLLTSGFRFESWQGSLRDMDRKSFPEMYQRKVA